MRYSVKTTLAITGTRSDVASLEEFVGKNYSLPTGRNHTEVTYTEVTSPIFSLWNILSPPRESHLEYIADRASWHVKLWGTTTEATEVKVDSRAESSISISFNTAWSTPSLAIATLSSNFENLYIRSQSYNRTNGFSEYAEYSAGRKHLINSDAIIPASHRQFERQNGFGSCSCREANVAYRLSINYAVDCVRFHVDTGVALDYFDTASRCLEEAQ